MSTAYAHVLVAHGSTSLRWRAPFEVLAQTLAACDPSRIVALCYLEKCTPTVSTVLDDLYRQGCRTLRVSPLFLSSGRHLDHDLPHLLTAWLDYHTDARLEVDPALGEQAAILSALAHALCAQPTAVYRPS